MHFSNLADWYINILAKGQVSGNVELQLHESLDYSHNLLDNQRCNLNINDAVGRTATSQLQLIAFAHSP